MEQPTPYDEAIETEEVNGSYERLTWLWGAQAGYSRALTDHEVALEDAYDRGYRASCKHGRDHVWGEG